MAKGMEQADYEPLKYSAQGVQGKEAFVEILEALIQTIKKSKGAFFRFNIKVEEQAEIRTPHMLRKIPLMRKLQPKVICSTKVNLEELKTFKRVWNKNSCEVHNLTNHPLYIKIRNDGKPVKTSEKEKQFIIASNGVFARDLNVSES